MKACCRCQEYKPLVAFSKCASRKDGLQPRCKACDGVLRAQNIEASRQAVRRSLAAYGARYAERNRLLKTSGRYKKARPDLHCLYEHRRRARKRNAAGGSYTADDIKRIGMGQNWRCRYCGTSLLPGYEVDHIVALANGGTNDADNIQLVCASCNRKKGRKSEAEFLRRLQEQRGGPKSDPNIQP